MTLTDQVLVTGAGGLIGSWCTRVMHNHGIRVAGWYKTTPRESLPWPVHAGDLGNISMEEIGAIALPYKTIVHCAAYLPSNNADLEKALEINRRIDENIIKFASANQIRLIYLSGTSVYGFSGDLFTEESATYLRGIARKYEVENDIQRLVQNYVILRVSAPYGPFQKSRTVLRIFIDNALAQKPLLFYGSGQREQDFTFAGDIAKAVLKCIEQPGVKGIFNITSGKSLNMKQLAEMVVENIKGCASEIRASGVPDEQENSRARYSIEKAKRIFGWQPETSLEEGIKKWVIHITDENRRDQ